MRLIIDTYTDDVMFRSYNRRKISDLINRNTQFNFIDSYLGKNTQVQLGSFLYEMIHISVTFMAKHLGYFKNLRFIKTKYAYLFFAIMDKGDKFHFTVSFSSIT